jgi:uncharacterized membrane protein YdjX (TVP38/TMEM64 family)
MPPSNLHPWLYGLILSSAVGLGLPAGALVVGAGAVFGPWLGLLTVLVAEAVGLILNWRLCRGLLRPRVERFLAHNQQTRLLAPLITQPAGLSLLILLRLALLPMNLVNAGCAAGPTNPKIYAVACLALIPRFALMVLAGATGAETIQDNLNPMVFISRCIALTASAAVLLLLAKHLQKRVSKKALR